MYACAHEYVDPKEMVSNQRYIKLIMSPQCCQMLHNPSTVWHKSYRLYTEPVISCTQAIGCSLLLMPNSTAAYPNLVRYQALA